MALRIDSRIEQTNSAIKKLEKQKRALENEKAKQIYINPYVAYKNAYDVMAADFTNSKENPMNIKFPMFVKTNLFYKYGDENTTKTYVAIKEGLVGEITDEYFAEV